MWNYEKRLEYPINIKRTDAAMAKAIISQFGGPDGETGAAMRYLSQRFAMPYRPVMGDPFLLYCFVRYHIFFVTV